MGTPVKSPVKRGGISYLQHFPKVFLRSYGPAHSVDLGSTMEKAVSERTCEFFHCLDYHMSECADTIQSNWEYVRENWRFFQDRRLLSTLSVEMETLLQQLSTLNTKGTTCSPTKDNVTSAVETLVESSEVVDKFMEASRSSSILPTR